MTTTDPWTSASQANEEAPKGGSGVQMEELVGKTILFTPKDYKEGIVTKYTPKGQTQDVVVADLAVIEPKVEDCAEHSDVWVLQGRLIRVLKGKVGNGQVLGKLVRDEDADNRPYDLEDASEAATEAARAYYAAKMAPPF